MTETHQNPSGTTLQQQSGSQGLCPLYDDDLSKDFVESLADTVNVLPPTGIYTFDRVHNHARKTLFDPADLASFETACASVQNFAEHMVVAFNRGAAAVERSRYSA